MRAALQFLIFRESSFVPPRVQNSPEVTNDRKRLIVKLKAVLYALVAISQTTANMSKIDAEAPSLWRHMTSRHI